MIDTSKIFRGQILKEFRKKRKLTTKEVARLTNIPYNTIISYENGRRELKDINHIVLLAKAVKISIVLLARQKVR